LSFCWFIPVMLILRKKIALKSSAKKLELKWSWLTNIQNNVWHPDSSSKMTANTVNRLIQWHLPEKVFMKFRSQIENQVSFFLFLAWRPSWLEVGITRHTFGRGPSKDHSTKVWLQLAKWFLRRRLKCEMLTDGRTKTWQGVV
jgi:hypothetical protein